MNLKSILRPFLAAITAMSVTIPAAALSEDGEMTADDINDLALIWIGGHSRSEWNKEMFTPYVMHTFQDGHKTWFFDGFLMLEGAIEQVENNRAVKVFSLGEMPADPANDRYPADQTQWEYLLDKQLGLIDGTGCKALDEAIGDHIPELGQPATKHKVVIMQCIPVGNSFEWGKIDGKYINFTYTDDKIKAMKWYTDLVIKKFNDCNFQNIVLDGIYWLREAITNAEIPLIKGMTPYYKEKGLKSYWIPWLHGNGYQQWKDFGIDVTYEQPGYFFSTDRPYSRLEQACEDAWDYDFGIELEFEGNCVVGYDENRVTQAQGNSALYGNSPVFHQRFIDYIDILEESLIFEAKQMSYYCGYQGVYDFAQSNHPKDKQLMDRLASILENRHILSGWYVPDNTGITDVSSESKAIITVKDRSISIKASKPIPVTVYTVSGTTVYDSAPAQHYNITCNKGIYIIKAGDTIQKVIVR